MIAWLRRRRRRRIGSRPLSSQRRQFLAANFAQYEWLSPGERARLDAMLQVLIAEKNWEGCNGLVMTDEIKVTIAAQAGRLVIGLNDEYFESIY
jgi:Mlc titration factor MtfA (ptsG expression regulator)